MRPRAVVLGGGAAGFFGAIRAAELAPDAEVLLLEATRSPLQKVRISGGGRCNVTHHLFEPSLLVKRYPRGGKELRGVLARWGPRETMAWFEARGVALKAEEDGRVFPVTDDSGTIVDALARAAEAAGVEVRLGASVAAAERLAPAEGAGAGRPALRLGLKSGEEVEAAALLLATGSNPQGHALARSLGHTIVPPVPSLFTFNLEDPRLEGLAGVAAPHVRATLKPSAAEGDVGDGGVGGGGGKQAQAALTQEGPLLVTHWGLSAHAVLRLSAWGARELHAAGYRATLVVDWLPEVREDQLRGRVDEMRARHPAATLGARSIAPELPRRLWERLLAHAGGDPEMRWAEVPNRGVHKLVEELKRGQFEVRGKGPFREEFVTAGGVARGEVDWRTMESRLAPGLFFAGEVLDVDAVTGGFNFQNAWSTGWIAGSAIGERLREG